MAVVNKDIRWGFVGVTINYSWLMTAVTERYDDDEEYDFEKELMSEFDADGSGNTLSDSEYKIVEELGQKIEKSINYGEYIKIGEAVEEAIDELAQLYRK